MAPARRCAKRSKPSAKPIRARWKRRLLSICRSERQRRVSTIISEILRSAQNDNISKVYINLKSEVQSPHQFTPTREALMYTSEGKKIVSTDKAPKAIGPYSQAIRTENLVFTAGQLGLDPATMELVPDGIEAQTRQALTNLKHVLETADSGLNFVVKTTVFLQDMSDFPKMNLVYSEFFPENPPARSTVQVAALPKGGLVEIECMALLSPQRGD